MPINQIVIKMKNGDLKKGNSNDFFPNKKSFHLNNVEGGVEEIRLEDAKAIFFVKDFAGNKDYNYNYEDNIPGGGRKVSVAFHDGETIIGFVLGYSPQREGFFITPADLSGNNERIYAVASSVKNVQFL